MNNEYFQNFFWGAFWWLVGTVSGFFVSLYFYKKSEVKVDLLCEIDSDVYVEDRTIYISKITIINKGKQICQNDFARLQPLSFLSDEYFYSHVDESNLFHSNLNNCLKANYISNGFSQYNQVELIYDFIEKNEKITCTLYHTGILHIIGRPRRGKIKVKQKETGITGIPFKYKTISSKSIKPINILYIIFIVFILGYLIVFYLQEIP